MKVIINFKFALLLEKKLSRPQILRSSPTAHAIIWPSMELSPLAISAIGGNAIALALMGICYWSCFYRFHKGVRTSQCLFWMLIVTSIVSVTEILSSVFDGWSGTGMRVVLYALNSVNFLAALVMMVLWLLFFLAYFTKKASKTHILLTHIPMAIGIILVILNLFFPIFFYLDANNAYVRGYGYYALLVLELSAAACTVFSTIFVRRHMEPFKNLSTYLFFTPIFVGCILQACFYGLALQWPSIAIGITGLILSAQNQSIYRDPLTGLYNRVYLSYLQRNFFTRKKTFTVIMADINDFKSVNDEFGHKIGDKALIDTARTLVSVVGESGSVVRYAGDEFLIIIPSEEKDVSEKYMSEINEAFAKQATTPERPYSISLSMGSIQCRLSNSDSLDEFMNQIDKRMYESKKRYHEAHHLSREYE